MKVYFLTRVDSKWRNWLYNVFKRVLLQSSQNNFACDKGYCQRYFALRTSKTEWEEKLILQCSSLLQKHEMSRGVYIKDTEVCIIPWERFSS